MARAVEPAASFQKTGGGRRRAPRAWPGPASGRDERVSRRGRLPTLRPLWWRRRADRKVPAGRVRVQVRPLLPPPSPLLPRLAGPSTRRADAYGRPPAARVRGSCTPGPARRALTRCCGDGCLRATSQPGGRERAIGHGKATLPGPGKTGRREPAQRSGPSAWTPGCGN